MSKRFALSFLVLLMLSVTGVQASAFTVVLNNGQTFDTRYYPVDAEWDDAVSMILSDQGNWIALDKQDIAEVTSAVDESGFGYRLDTSTLVVGWTYNEGDEGGGSGGADGGDGVGGAGGIGGVGGTAGTAQSADEGYSIDQFVNTGSAGSTGGIPLEYTSYE